METLELEVEGMKCLACCARVKSSIMSIPGVQSCRVDFESRLVTVKAHGLAHGRVFASLRDLGYDFEMNEQRQGLQADTA